MQRYNSDNARGVLRIHTETPSWQPEIVRALQYLPQFDSVPSSPGRTGDEKTLSDRDYLERLRQRLKPEIINHRRFFRRSIPRPIDLNYHLVECLWQYVKSWCEENLRYRINSQCPVSIAPGEEMEAKRALGLFLPDTCEIRISEEILYSEPYTLIVLAHEYMHYVEYCITSWEDYGNCPKILSEGFSEYGCRLFYEEAKYKIPKEMRKSWNEYYERGRWLVEHIAEEEGFGIKGFVNGFLYNIQPDNPLKFLDPLFK